MSITEKKIKSVAWTILACAFCFMICIFAPLDAYFANITEYWFKFRDILPVVLISFAVAFVLTAIVFALLGRTQLSQVLFAAFTVLLVFLYVQGNYLPRNYGVLNGSDIDWASYTGLGIASIVLALICVALLILIIIKFRDYVYTIGKYVALFLIIIQVVTLGTIFIQKNVLSMRETEDNIVVTDKDLLTLSGNGDNIVVFLLDTFDVEYMNKLMEEDLDKYDKILENFTWYPDTLGTYPTTKGSMPYIFTGVWYENEIPYKEYVAKAYEESMIIPTLKENGYTLDVYTEEYFLDHAENSYNNVFNSTYRLINPLGFAKNLFKLVAFNYMPHQLKRLFVIDTSSFERFKGVDEKGNAYSQDMEMFYKTVCDSGYKIEDRGNLFKFYHLEGIHGPYTFGEEVQRKDGERYNVETEAKGNMTLLKEAFDQMKAADIYDGSTIIVMADHGCNNRSQNPIFMIKNRNESHEFEKSDAPMTYEYLSSIFMELANGNDVDSVFINSLKPSHGKRRFLYYSWDHAFFAKNYLPGMDEMYLDGYAWDPKNLIASGIRYLPNEDSKDYKVGTTLLFCNNVTTAQPYIIYGCSSSDANGAWMEGMESMMKMKLKGQYNNLCLSLEANPCYRTQYVRVFANDHEVGSWNVDNKAIFSVIIPHEYVMNDDLTIKFQIDTPPSGNGIDVTSKKERLYTLFMKTISLNSTDQPFELALQQAPVPQESKVVFFSSDLSTIQGVKENDRIMLKKGQVQFGPYIWLGAGSYKICVEGEGFSNVSYRVTADYGKTIIPVELIDRTDEKIIYQFTLQGDMENVEFLVDCIEDATVYVDRILLSSM